LSDDGANERRDGLLSLEDKLIDLQDFAVELRMETTAALLRMALLDVREELGFKRTLNAQLSAQNKPR
jgi:hypothetical protein